MNARRIIFRHAMKILFLRLLAIPLLAFAAFAQDAPAPAPAMREISPGIFEIGKLRLDQKALTITFPATLNMDRGLLEYLIVTPRGSTHESLLVTEVQPGDIHFAMLLLGAKGSGEKPGDAATPPPQIDSKYLKGAPKLKGDTIFISVKWMDGAAEKTVRVEDWLANEKTKTPVNHGPWIYNGSMFSNGHFLAQSEGAIAALVTNPSALINNPRKGNDDDQIWAVNEKTVPALHTPLEVSIQLAKPDAANSDH
jgi:hypothetical protein